MSLAEIEAAAEALSPDQKAELVRFLAARLRPPEVRREVAAFKRSKRGFPISPGRASFAAKDVAWIEAEADANT